MPPSAPDRTPLAPGPAALLAVGDPWLRPALAEELRRQGFPTFAAGDGWEAGAGFAGLERGFDLLVAELASPAVDGVRLALDLRARRPDLAVLLLDADPAPGHRRFSRGAGLRVARLPLPLPEIAAAARAELFRVRRVASWGTGGLRYAVA